jgi:microcompartment protein CcmL/EutN
MKSYPAIAMIESRYIGNGILAGDAMIKRAPVSVLKTGTVSKGKYLVLVGGSVASVEEAFSEGLRVTGPAVIDSVILPDVHPSVLTTALGERETSECDALGIVDTLTTSAILRCSDAAVKGAEIEILEMRLGDGLGGHAFALYGGRLEDVEAAVAIAHRVEDASNYLANTSIVSHIDPRMLQQLYTSTRFASTGLQDLPDGEM